MDTENIRKWVRGASENRHGQHQKLNKGKHYEIGTENIRKRVRETSENITKHWTSHKLNKGSVTQRPVANTRN